MVCKRFLSLIFIFLLHPSKASHNATSGTAITSGSDKPNFYAEPKNKKHETKPKKLKENIGNELADLMQIAHKNIELYSQICQEIFREIQDLVDQNKNSKIYNANSKELQKCLEELEDISCKWQTELEQLKKTKEFFKSGCIN